MHKPRRTFKSRSEKTRQILADDRSKSPSFADTFYPPQPPEFYQAKYASNREKSETVNMDIGVEVTPSPERRERVAKKYHSRNKHKPKRLSTTDTTQPNNKPLRRSQRLQSKNSNTTDTNRASAPPITSLSQNSYATPRTPAQIQRAAFEELLFEQTKESIEENRLRYLQNLSKTLSEEEKDDKEVEDMDHTTAMLIKKTEELTLDDLLNDDVDCEDQIFDPATLVSPMPVPSRKRPMGYLPAWARHIENETKHETVNVTKSRPVHGSKAPRTSSLSQLPTPSSPSSSPGRKRKQSSGQDTLAEQYSPPRKMSRNASHEQKPRRSNRIAMQRRRGSSLDRLPSPSPTSTESAPSLDVAPPAAGKKRGSRTIPQVSQDDTIVGTPMATDGRRKRSMLRNDKEEMPLSQPVGSMFDATPAGSIRTRRVFRLTQKSHSQLLMDVLMKRDSAQLQEIRKSLHIRGRKWSKKKEMSTLQFDGSKYVGELEAQCERLIHYLLGSGADPCRVNSDYKSPIYLLIHYKKCANLLHLMIENSNAHDLTQPFYVPDGPLTLLDIALRLQNAEYVKLLLKNNVGPTVTSSNSRHTVLMEFAKRHKCERLARRVLSDVMWEAVESVDKEQVQTVLAHGLPIDVRDRHRATPLYKCVEIAINTTEVTKATEHVQLIKFLCENGANVNAMDSSQTPMICHCIPRTTVFDIIIVRTLLQHGADTTIPVAGIAVVSFAQQYGIKQEIIELVQKKYQQQKNTKKGTFPRNQRRNNKKSMFSHANNHTTSSGNIVPKTRFPSNKRQSNTHCEESERLHVKNGTSLRASATMTTNNKIVRNFRERKRQKPKN